MSTYAIGDLQGCLAPFDALLDEIRFNPDHDRLLLAGDLVNRGPDSLGALRRVHELRDNARVVLGNHDLHLLAVAHGHAELKSKDTLQPILDAPDRDSLLGWLQSQPLLVEVPEFQTVMTHAGLPPLWRPAPAHWKWKPCSPRRQRPGNFSPTCTAIAPPAGTTAWRVPTAGG